VTVRLEFYHTGSLMLMMEFSQISPLETAREERKREEIREDTD